MNNIERFLKKNSSNILTIAGSLGLVGTVILAVKATSKALKLIEEAEEVEDNIIHFGDEEYHSIKKRELTLKMKIQIAWKPYIPSFCMGMSTILCIFGSNYLNKQYQKNLIAAYTVLNNSFLQYRENAKKLYGDNIDNNISKELLKDVKIDEELENDNDKELFFDCKSMRYFRSTYEDVKKAEKLFNEHLSKNGYGTLNELYELIGIPPVKYGYDIGWSTYLNDQLYGHSGIELSIELAELDDSLDCWVINIECEPTTSFIY